MTASSARSRVPANWNPWCKTKSQPIERTYSDNEVRIRGLLLQDLANQRDALVGQAEQVQFGDQ